MSSDQPDEKLVIQPSINAEENLSLEDTILDSAKNIDNDTATPSAALLDLQDAEPGRLHWTSLVFDIISHGRNYLFPVVIALFSVAKGEQRGIYIAGLFFFPSLALSLFRYFTLRYRITNRQFVVSQGLIFRNVRTVPVERIQNVDLVQNLLHRLFKVAEVRIETASGSEPEAVLRVLSMDQVERLREEIFGSDANELIRDSDSVFSDGFSEPLAQDERRDSESPDSFGAGSSHVHVPTYDASITGRKPNSLPSEKILEIPLTWLIRAGLASNRGMIMVGIALGLAYNFEMLDFQVNLKSLRNLLPPGLSQTMMVILAVLGLIGLWLVLRLLGVGWYILRFSNYRLLRKGEDLQISCGLLTKVSATVPRQRIQLISIHRNLLMRWMKLASIRIETAGSSSERDDATKSVSRQWFLPVVPQSEVNRILRVLRPGLDWQPDQLNWTPLCAKAFGRRMRPIVLISLALIGGGIYYSPAWGWIPGLALFLLWTFLNRLNTQSSRYSRFESGVVFESDWFNRKTTLTFFERIQVIKFAQSPFDRKWKMASLSVDTAGAGAAEHSIAISMLDAEFASVEQFELRKLAAIHQPDYS